jgi:hypothetical protein
VKITGDGEGFEDAGFVCVVVCVVVVVVCVARVESKLDVFLCFSGFL